MFVYLSSGRAWQRCCSFGGYTCPGAQVLTLGYLSEQSEPASTGSVRDADKWGSNPRNQSVYASKTSFRTASHVQERCFLRFLNANSLQPDFLLPIQGRLCTNSATPSYARAPTIESARRRKNRLAGHGNINMTVRGAQCFLSLLWEAENAVLQDH